MSNASVRTAINISPRHSHVRAEFFNALNNVNFTVPGPGSANPNQSAAGNIVGTGNFGKFTTAADPRILQFALKFMF